MSAPARDVGRVDTVLHCACRERCGRVLVLEGWPPQGAAPGTALLRLSGKPMTAVEAFVLDSSGARTLRKALERVE